MPNDSTLQTKSEAFLSRIQAMSEKDFTHKVIMPLFNFLGFSVDHHGGQLEGGKDVICWKNGSFGRKELLVIQVKKTRASAAANSKNSFSEIITQLQQASEKQVPCLDGLPRRPDSIYFITPFNIDTRALESRFEGMSNLALRGVRVLDGSAIFEELRLTMPSLVEEVCGDEFTMKYDLLANNVSNSDLLSALNYSTEKNIEDFYCDLDFSVGRLTSRIFFSLTFSGKRLPVSLDMVGWNKMQKISDRIQEQAQIDIILPSKKEVVSIFDAKNAEWESDANRELINRAYKISSEIESTLKFVISGCAELVNDALIASSEHTPFGPKTTRTFSETELDRLEVLRQAKLNLEGQYTLWLDAAELDKENLVQTKKVIDAATQQLNRLRTEGFIINAAESGRIAELLRYLRLMNKHYEELAKIAPLVKQRPEYAFSINGAALAPLLEEWRAFIANGISELSNKRMSREETRSYFQKCQSIFSTVGEILDFRILVDAAGISSPQKFAINLIDRRIQMPMREVFATGIDCAVYGEAGAGKSTTLFKYASEASRSDSKDDLTLFLPLTRLLANLRERGDDESIAPVSKLKTEIAAFLNTKKNIPNDDIIHFLRAKRRVIFIFDGVDEVIKTAPWIVDAIDELRKEFQNAQVILSARSSGRYLDSTNYLGLTILPFSDEQVEKFIRGWFKSQQEIASQVLEHLENTKSLAEIVRNPLLATVLCVLAENRVPLPAGELSLYSERMKLLLGHYDIHKKTKRLSTHHVVLEATARKLAFQLHQLGTRSAAPGHLEELAIKALRHHKFEGVKEAEIRTAVMELIDPCNILEPMTDDGDIGFGHLRFQEYLCAVELCQNRGIDILPLLKNPWWRSAIVLFGRLTDDIEHVINDVLEKQVNIATCRDSLTALIETRNKREQRELKRLLESHARLDRLSKELLDFNEYDYSD